MGMRSWRYLDALTTPRRSGPLPCRVRVYLASGLADEASLDEIDARRADCGPWLRLDGIKFYADGWLVPRTCAVCQDFADTAGRGVLFAGGPARPPDHAAGRPAAGESPPMPSATGPWRRYWTPTSWPSTATWAPSPPRRPGSSTPACCPASSSRGWPAAGVAACIQPSFAVTDAAQIVPALGPDRARARLSLGRAGAGRRFPAGWLGLPDRGTGAACRAWPGCLRTITAARL